MNVTKEQLDGLRELTHEEEWARSALTDDGVEALSDLLADHAAGKEREKRLRDALEFYADEFNHSVIHQGSTAIRRDGGDIARSVLVETLDTRQETDQ